MLAGRDDWFFPVGSQRRVARGRLDVEADVIRGGHLLPLAQPRLVTDYLLKWAPVAMLGDRKCGSGTTIKILDHRVKSLL